MSLTFYEQVHLAPLARRAKPAMTRTNRARLEDLEFGEWGRNPRYAAGWFILPSFMIAIGIATALLAGIL